MKSFLLLLLSLTCAVLTTAARTSEPLLPSPLGGVGGRLDTLVFETVSYNDSLITDLKIVEDGSDEETSNFTWGKSHNYYTKTTIHAISGRPEVVAFVNQWLTLDAAGKYTQEMKDAATVAKEYAKLGAEGSTNMLAVLKRHCDSYLHEDLLEEFGWETGNEYYNNIEVVMNTEYLLTIYDHGSMYPAGAAHGMPWSACTTFDLKNLRKMELDDIIKESNQAVVLDMLIKELYDEYGEESLNENIDFGTPALTPEGVIFCYGAYEIGPYALGMPEIIIPYSKILPYLTTNAKSLIPAALLTTAHK